MDVLNQPLVQGLLSWLLFGLVVGVAAKLLLPGREEMGWMRTIVVGILGSFLGGFLGSYFHIAGATSGMAAWNLPAFLTAVAGAFILVVLNRIVTKS